MTSGARRCRNCNAPVPALKTDGRAKMFRKPLSKTSEKGLKKLGTSFGNVLKEDDDMDVEETEENTAAGEDSDEKEDTEENFGRKKKQTMKKSDSNVKLLLPIEVREHIRLLYEQEKEALPFIFGAIFQEHEVPPSRRSDHNVYFFEVLPVSPSKFRPLNEVDGQLVQHPQSIYYSRILALNSNLLSKSKERGDRKPTPQEVNDTINTLTQMQHNLNFLFDNKDAPSYTNLPAGIIQLLEKKEGLFRKNMMGKRVNYSARTVISPDPLIQTNEIGIPLYFAMNLTYAEPVTERNFKILSEAVIRGAHQHPGANAIEDEKGNIINLKNLSYEERVSKSKLLRTFTEDGAPHAIKKVYRHLRTGDIVLANRQPTLHKPSVMGHFVKVLKTEKTLRLHYANCATYNADFDGDEMNVHFPQNELGRAEAINIAVTDNQYLSPKNGAPLRGLIQDHVVTGVLLTKRDTFFTRTEFMQLVYSACLEVNSHHPIDVPPPVIWKPQMLWTGKQVITAVLNQLTHGKPTLNLDTKGKIPEEQWDRDSLYAIIIRQNELLCGVLDKTQFGASAFGLVHACYELHGPKIAGQLLSILGRLFTLYLQSVGFTCGMDDLLLSPLAENMRNRGRKESEDIGSEVGAEFTGKPKDDQEEVRLTLATMLTDDKQRSMLDRLMKSKLNPITTKISNYCLSPEGLVKQFPKNNLALMTTSGAKGSNVNFSQISSLLGQQELEGKRVPVMSSGKTLPCFDPFDTSARAGGFIMDRFLTGIKPQEYFFHCMAGREGLIDTAVKTSRSGYLQRCLIKHLEGLSIQYDYTVRDSDGSVIQFYYGEDALDVGQTKWLTNFSFLAQNYEALSTRYKPKKTKKEEEGKSTIQATTAKEATAYWEQLNKNPNKDPIMSKLNPSYHLGAVSEKFYKKLEDYIAQDPDEHFRKGKLNPQRFKANMCLKYISSMAHPGEAVGIIAAQSIGEPSTQMTLNTFHMAGRGDVNVTLGIPRLREIIMSASDKIENPATMLYLKDESERSAQSFAKLLYKIQLTELLKEITVTESMKEIDGFRCRFYKLVFVFQQEKNFGSKFNLDYDELYSILESRFIPTLTTGISKELKKKSTEGAVVSNVVSENRSSEARVDEEDEDEPQGSDDENNAAVSEKIKQRKREMVSYEEPDDDEREIIRKQNEQEQAQDIEVDKSQDLYDTEQQQQQDDREFIGTTVVEDEAEAEPTAESDAEDSPDSEPMTITERKKMLGSSEYLYDYDWDPKSGTFEVQLKIPFLSKKVLMMGMVDRITSSFVLKHVPRINKCHVMEYNAKEKKFFVQTEGVNFGALWNFRKYLDVNRIYSNDIWSVIKTYGVEAGRSVIVKEIATVFEMYGISVDPRHLSLIADYMTFDGGFRAMNRPTMEFAASPLQRMSFETTMKFMTTSALRGDYDELRSPSACIVVGKPMRMGTGAFECIQPLHYN